MNHLNNCPECDGSGRIYNNADKSSNMWVDCNACDVEKNLVPKGVVKMFYEVEDSPIAMQIEFDYKPGTDEVFDKGHGNYLPGDDPELKLLHVWIGASNGKIDILSNLSSADRARLENLCQEYAEINQD